MFELKMLPASDGDCLLLSYGDGADIRHVVVDGGRTGAYPFLKASLTDIAQRGQRVELLVLSHIDADHIEGFLPLASETVPPAAISEIWYNGFDQLSSVKPMGPGQGDRFSEAIRARGWKLNTHFSRRIAVMPDGHPISLDLPGGLKITILSPDAEKLSALRDEWEEWRTEAAAKVAEQQRKQDVGGLQGMGGRRPFPRVLNIDALATSDEVVDDEAPNGSSIAFVAQWKGKRILFGADAHPDLLARSIAPLAAAEGGRYRIDLYKVAHHGSRKNTTRALIDLLDCNRFAISTSGARHGHPDPETVARLLKSAPKGAKTFYFNYRQENTSPWGDIQLQAAHNYVCSFPSEQNGTITISI
jgi:hypothetical protein